LPLQKDDPTAICQFLTANSYCLPPECQQVPHGSYLALIG
jgi:hypothetical protein